jgi:hypothetical protein
MTIITKIPSETGTDKRQKQVINIQPSHPTYTPQTKQTAYSLRIRLSNSGLRLLALFLGYRFWSFS